MNRAVIAIVLFVLWTLASFWAGWEWRDRGSDIKQLRSELQYASDANDALVETLNTERADAKRLAAIAATYEQEKIDALDREARLRADLGTGNRKLRHEIGALYTAQLSQGAAHSAELAVAAERGAEAVAAAVAVGAACDARDRAWRALAEADRAPVSP